jgi:glycosyltransferase involved in cell wall biosynthesis
VRVLVALLSIGFAGTERHALELANALSRHCDVALLLRERPRAAHQQAAYDALLRSIDPGLRVFFASRAMPVLGLWRAIAHFHPDLIHAHHERSARIASRYAFGVPVLATVHMHYRARDFARCNGLICLTQAEAVALPHDYAGARFVIGNWMIPQPRPPAEAVQSLRGSFGIQSGDYVIGAVARLEPVKGLDGLIIAFHAAALPRSRLMIVGQGDQQAALIGLARQLGVEERVIFTGFRADARVLYPLFDVFVLNSSDEPYGLVILEAAAAGVPVIATVTVGATAIAEHLPLRLVPTGSQSELVQAIRDTWTQRQPAAMANVHAFSIEHRVAEILAAYCQVVPHAPPPDPARCQASLPDDAAVGKGVDGLDKGRHENSAAGKKDAVIGQDKSLSAAALDPVDHA